MQDIPFVDAHVHLWDLAHLRYPWLTPPFGDEGPNGSVAEIARTYLPADYLAEASAWTVAGYVHVDAGAHAADCVAETEWVSSLRNGPDGIVAFAALDNPAIDALLDAHAEHDRVRGIRHIVNWHADPRRTYTPRDLTSDAAWARGFSALARHGLSFDLQAYPDQFAGLAALFERNPEVPVIIDHLGMPLLSGPNGREAWRVGLRTLAALPNVFIKISGFGFVTRSWSVADARPFVLDAIDMFGSHRACVASDFPTDRLFGTFDATLGAYAEIIHDLTYAEKLALWGGNADRFYRLGIFKESARG